MGDMKCKMENKKNDKQKESKQAEKSPTEKTKTNKYTPEEKKFADGEGTICTGHSINFPVHCFHRAKLQEEQKHIIQYLCNHHSI